MLHATDCMAHHVSRAFKQAPRRMLLVLMNKPRTHLLCSNYAQSGNFFYLGETFLTLASVRSEVPPQIHCLTSPDPLLQDFCWLYFGLDDGKHCTHTLAGHEIGAEALRSVLKWKVVPVRVRVTQTLLCNETIIAPRGRRVHDNGIACSSRVRDKG